MQRRLAIAMIGIALAAILFVGAGVLGFAQIGAEREARELAIRQLAAVVEIAEASPNFERAGPAIERAGTAFDLRVVRFGAMTRSGELHFGRPRRGTGSRGSVTLGPNQIATVLAGQPFVIKEGGLIRGIQLVDAEFMGEGRAVPIVLIERNIATIGNRPRAWFALSGAIVLLAAGLVAWYLSRRFTEPVRQATATTGAIAAGDLSARMPVKGDDELARLGNSINSMATELERGRAAEQQFLLSISHDLRTPLTAISGYAEAMQDGATTDSRRVGTILKNHAGRLDRLIDDLLNLAKLEARQFQFNLARVDASAVAGHVAVGQAPIAKEHDLTVQVEAANPTFVTADADRLAQIIGNLMDNATKFAASTITVAVSTEIRSPGQEGSGPGSHCVISVSDDGPGIPPEDLPHVFERLYVTQLKPVRSESSSGLGLAIVRELSTAMGGSVRALAGSGGGTRIEVVFPLADVPGTPPAGRLSEPVSG